MTRYELTERIGVGAMAEIFRGKAIAGGGFEKPVAIKRILPQLSEDRHFVELLIAEANIVSHLHHRNIVQVFDVGQGPDGEFFLVLEYVDGADLRTLQAGLEAEGKRLPIDLGLYIGAEICDALEHAHLAPGPDGQPLRLVHRDVAPSNVLLSRSGEVKLTDFGIAKRAEEATVHGGVRGKFAYISPEQAYSRPVDARSDVYSVGILLFELLLGKRLFSQMADFDALRAVREGQVPRPRSVDPALDPRLEAILLQALAHDPGARFSGAAELGKALRTFRYSMPSTGTDPALELASAVSYYGEKGRIQQAKAAASGDGMSTSGSFTITDRDSLVRKQSFAKARQVLDALAEEEIRMAQQDGIMAGDSAELEALLGAEPLVPDAEPEEDHGVAEEETRIVLDPFLSSQAAQRRSAPAAGARPSAPQPAVRPSAVQSAVRPSAAQPAVRPSAPQPAVRPPAQRSAIQPVAQPLGGELDMLPPPSPPETITGVEPVVVPVVSAPEPGTVRGADGVARPMAERPSRGVMHTGAMPTVKRSSRLFRWTLILLVIGGLVAAAMLHEGTKDKLLRLGKDLVARVKALAAPDAVVPDAAVPAVAPPDAAVPDAAPPDAASPDASMADAGAADASTIDGGMVDGGLVDAASPDAASAAKKKRKRRKKRRRRRSR